MLDNSLYAYHRDSRSKTTRYLYKGIRPPRTPKYGLGYIKQCDQFIPDCRFSNTLPKNMQRPSIDEI
jgi:hypothetical protein